MATLLTHATGASRIPAVRRRQRPHLADFVWRGLDRLALMVDVWHERRALAALDDRALNDLGLSRSTALAEAERAPWDLPAGREMRRRRQD